MPKLINFINFQIGWFACALGAAAGWPWAGVAVVTIIVAWHLTRVAQPRQELILIGAAMVIGALWESLLVRFDLIQYPNGMLIDGTAPAFMVALWALFATTLNVSMAWLKRNHLLAILFGAVGGPLAYYAGAKLGALELVDQTTSLVTLALGWALLTPLLLQLARHHDGLLSTSDSSRQREISHG